MYGIFDSRVNKPVTVAAFNTRLSAEAQIAAWRRRDVERPKERPDCRESLPFLEARELPFSYCWPDPLTPT